MKIYTAHFDHETNTFSPVPTPLDRFTEGRDLPLTGDEAYQACKGTMSPLGGFILSIEEAGHIACVGPAATGEPSGPVDQAAYECIATMVLDGIKGCDAVLISLHGAMVTDDYDDGEGVLLERIRQRYPAIPIAVCLDMHANNHQKLADNADVIAGCQSYPHIDFYETALKAGRVLMKQLAGDFQPTMAFAQAPMIPHIMRQGTDDQPNKGLQELCQKYEAEGALSVSLFTGFPHADIYNAGLSVIVVTDNDQTLADRIANHLLEKAWAQRKDFIYQIEPLAETVAAAKDYAESHTEACAKDGAADEHAQPILILDHYDNTSSGGTMETTEVLREVIQQGLVDVAFFGIWDPEAVAEMAKVGIGAEIELTIGGKFPIACFEKQTEKLTVKGIVKTLTNGRFQITGKMGRGTWAYMGPSAVLDLGAIEIVFISRHMEPHDIGCFISMGINPYMKKFLMIKSRIHYRTSYWPIVKKTFECSGFGVCTSDYTELPFKNIRRPIFPLDDFEWNPDKG